MNKKVEGIVLRQSEYRDSDMILSVFTREEGKMSFLARGLKKAKSKNASHCALFTHSDFYYLDNGKKGMKTLKNAERKKMFHHIYEDLLTQTCAQLMCECIEKIAEEADEDLFVLLQRGLTYLHEQKNPLLVLSLFLVHCNAYCGIIPYVDGCVRCKSPSKIASISLKDGGFLCVNCMDLMYHKKYSEQELRSFRLLHKASMEDFDVLSTYVEANYEFVEMLLYLLEDYSGVVLKTKSFLDKIV